MVHARSLLRTALRLARDRALAEDMVQETLLRGWKSFDQFEPGTNCKAWLFKIMLNLYNRNRQQNLAGPMLVAMEESEVVRLSFTREPQMVSGSEVMEALDTLPSEQRAVLMLGVIEGFTCKEMAEILQVPMGTVMSRLSRARQGLRSRLQVNSDINGKRAWSASSRGKGVQ